MPAHVVSVCMRVRQYVKWNLYTLNTAEEVRDGCTGVGAGAVERAAASSRIAAWGRLGSVQWRRPWAVGP